MTTLIPVFSLSETAIFKIQTKIPAPSFVIGKRIAIAYYHVKNSWSVPLEHNALTVNNAVKHLLDQDDDSCNTTIDLSAKSSCILKLTIDGAKLKTSINKGPRLCHTKKNPVYCSDPLTKSDQLHITPVSNIPANAPRLTVDSERIILQPHVDTLIAVSNHSSKIAANNVNIVTHDTPFDGLVDSDNTQCLHVLPQTQCILVLRLKKPVDLDETPLSIQGANTQTTQLTTSLSSTVQNQQHALITDAQTNEVKACQLNESDVSLSHCQSTLHADYKISAINVSSNKKHAYLADNSLDSIQSCDLNSETGELSHCMKAAGGFKHIDYGFVSFNRYGTQAYIPDGGANNIVLCDVEETGMLQNCNPTGTHFHDPEALILNTTQTQAYISNFSSNTITHCQRSSSGKLSSCQEQDGFDGPIDISINNDDTRLYVTDFQGHTVSTCELNAQGSLSNCHTTGNNFNQPVAIRLSLLNDYAYIVNSGVFGQNSVSQCKIEQNGELTHCVQHYTTEFKSPYGMVLF